MKKSLYTIPFFVAVIPLFFVLHGYRENLGYIHPGDAVLLAAVYLVASLATFGFFFLVYHRIIKAALAAAFILTVYFFFGAFQDFLKAYLHPLSHYTVVLPLILAGTAAWLIWLRRRRRGLTQLVFYLNILLLIYVLVDVVLLIHPQKTSAYRDQETASRDTLHFTPYTGQAKPDIYFLVLDAYSSSKALREQYHYDNSEFDRFLMSRGFHIQQASTSNYKYTILSMPSILNMGYLDNLKDVKGGPLAEYEYLSRLIKDNDVMQWLQANGYEVVNCSIFDLRGRPSPVEESLLPLQTRLITAQTLYSRFYRDIGWNFYQYTINPFSEKEIDRSLNNDNLLIGRLLAASSVKTVRPRFFYGHFNIPHPPYYFDKAGRRRKVSAPYRSTDEDRLQDYLDYLPYTNRRAEGIIDTILKNTAGQAVIILMGDHGLRYHDDFGYNPRSFVQNQNAVYFPNRDYHLFYDSISGVNQFRVVLNSLFGQQLPLLKDSIVNVKDKK